MGQVILQAPYVRGVIALFGPADQVAFIQQLIIAVFYGDPADAQSLGQGTLLRRTGRRRGFPL